MGTLDHTNDGGNLHAGVRAEDGDALRALLTRDVFQHFEHQSGDHGGVLAPIEAHEPGAVVGEVEVAEGVFDFGKHGLGMKVLAKAVNQSALQSIRISP